MARGTALAETALTVSLALLVIFNSLELALLGFYQLHADAAAYFTARYDALSTNSQPDTAAKTALGTTLPPAYPSPSVQITEAPFAQSIVTQSWPGLLLLPGVSGSTTVYGEHIEPIPPISGVNSVNAFTYGVQTAQIQNYWDPQSNRLVAYPTQPNKNLGLALVDTVVGNGSNGIFHYFSEHDACYQKLINSLPSGGMPAPGTYDPANQATEKTIYGWDPPGNNNGTC
jgi:hypothetical protein